MSPRPARALSVVSCHTGVRLLLANMLAGCLIAAAGMQTAAAQSAAPAAATAPAAAIPESAEDGAAAAGPRPVALVVPFAARGPTDTVARALAAALEEQLRYPVVVQNVAGAGGTAGAAFVAGAAPDGMTLLLHHVGMATAPALYRSLPYDPRRDFEPVGRILDVPMTLVARPDFPVRTPADAVRHIRQHQDSLVMAYAGLGAASHLCGLLLSMSLQVDLIQVPYRGTAPALQDLQNSQADLMCDQTTNTGAAIHAGRIIGLAVTSARRLHGMPFLPTAAEAGIRGLELSIWHGLFAPRGTPQEIIRRLALALQHALASPAFVRSMNDMHAVIATPDQASPAGLKSLLESELARWAPIIRKAGQYAD